jgi:hypothetical protein
MCIAYCKISYQGVLDLHFTEALTFNRNTSFNNNRYISSHNNNVPTGTVAAHVGKRSRLYPGYWTHTSELVT